MQKLEKGLMEAINNTVEVFNRTYSTDHEGKMVGFIGELGFKEKKLPDNTVRVRIWCLENPSIEIFYLFEKLGPNDEWLPKNGKISFYYPVPELRAQDLTLN